MPIAQSGNVTPGHLAKWVTDNVIGDAGASTTPEQVLAYLNCSFNDTNDQPFVIPAAITVFCITRIIVTNASLNLTTAVGGFYTGASKTGTIIVAAAQTYTSLTSSSKLMNPTLASGGSGTRFSAANVTANTIYLSLTTGQGAAATADVYLCGFDLTTRS